MTFAGNLVVGQLGESEIARWMISRGNLVLPVYEKQIDTGKGPRFFTPMGQMVAPDMFIMNAKVWVEAKHKTHFTWHRKTQEWVTGIDLHHYAEYQRVAEITGHPVWLIFLHKDCQPSDDDLGHGCPSRCPSGLFCGGLDFLRMHESHQHANWGRHGMVYWRVGVLQKLASVDDRGRLPIESEAA